MPSSYLGTNTGLAGIPSLLISSLQQVDDPIVRTALYQIQNWCNSVGVVKGITGGNTAGFGVNNSPAIFAGSVAEWLPVTLHGNRAYIPCWA
jgi:hypothetical protein